MFEQEKNQHKVLVTGVSRGIGLSIAQTLLQEGYSVIGTSREVANITIKSKNLNLIFFDLNEISSNPKLISRIKKQCGSINSLVLNAGYGQFGCLEEFSVEQINKLINVNLVAQIQLVRLFIPQLKKQRNGNIVFIGSEAALHGGRMGAVYSAAKFGLRGFAQALRHECARSAIQVSIINPGMVESQFFDELDFEPGLSADNKIQPQQVADAVSYIISSKENLVIDEINLSPLKTVVMKKKPIIKKI